MTYNTSNKRPRFAERSKVKGFSKNVSTFALIQTAIPFIVVAVLSSSHIYLHFYKTDMVIQLTQLQAHKRKLIAEQARLLREKEALCDLNRLKAFATQDLKMVEIDKPSRELLTVVDAELKSKYTEPLKKGSAPVLAAQKETFGEKLIRFVNPSKAMAAPIN